MEAMTVQPRQPVEALLFDLGNVLVEIDFGRMFIALERGSGASAADLRERFVFDEAYEKHERGELTFAEYARSLRRNLGLDLGDDTLLAAWNAIFVRPVPGIEALLEQVGKRWPLYALTNSNAAHQKVWARDYAEILAPFGRVFVSSEMGWRKPQPEAFLQVAQEIGVLPEQILFFDDTLENIVGAQAVGLQTVHVLSHKDTEVATEEALRVLERTQTG